MHTTDNSLKIADYSSLPSLDEIKRTFLRSDSLPTNSEELPYLDPEFTLFLFKHNIYQVYTQEFINTLSTYLIARIEEYYSTFSSPVTIIEVGAGDGRLSHFLRQKMANLIAENKLTVIASDNKNWEKSGETNTDPHDQVLNLDYKDCLKQYAKTPTILISCWMNVDVDWTEDFRANEHVNEYIMIGDLFRTAYYGKGYYLPKNSGFRCHKLSQKENENGEKIVKGLLGRFDGSPHNPTSRTEVYAFIRVNKTLA